MFWKKKELYSPIVGKVIDIEEVPDDMFSKKLLGDGVAFEIESDIIFSPCDGKVLMIAETNHAIGIEVGKGIEVLIHVGLDTVNFKGEGLKRLVKIGEKVKKGMPLLKVDREFFEEQKINLVTPMIVMNKDKNVTVVKNGQVGLEDVVIEIC